MISITAIVLGVPIAYTLITGALIGTALVLGFEQSLVQFHSSIWEVATNNLFVNVPLYIFMGHLINQTGMARSIFECLYRWFGRLPGGISTTSVLSSASFGALTGSSIATISTVGTMVIPEMRRYNYSTKLAMGSIASAGSLAILIPPSIPLVFYGLWTETSIAALFLAGVIPGLLLALIFTVYISTVCYLNPNLGPRSAPTPLREKIRELPKLVPALIIFAIIFGGIYSGYFSPTESAAVGIFVIMVFASVGQKLSVQNVLESIRATARISGSILLILAAGVFMSRFLALTDITTDLVNWVLSAELNRYLLLFYVFIIYLLLGAVIDTFGMVILTLPLVFPMMTQAGFDPVWFGIFLVLMIEISLITPPIGINTLLLGKLFPEEATLKEIFLGCIPFLGCILLLILLVVIYPELVLWLPNSM